MKTKSAVYPYLLCALFAALTAVLSQIMIPLPFTPIPINLALLAVWVCGGILGPKKAAIAMLVYILLGAVGVPVFVGFGAGLGILSGPTGGFIIGYLPSAVVMGLLMARGGDKNYLAAIVRGLPAVAVVYALGTAWFMILMGTGLIESLVLCVLPFIPGDILKIVAASAICKALKKPLSRLNN